jgi:hypothetical protein
MLFVGATTGTFSAPEPGLTYFFVRFVISDMIFLDCNNHVAESH